MAIRYRNAGFTLLEVLITLVIAGLLISLASLAISRNPRTEQVETGEQLALLFESATDEAHIRARQIAWQPVRGGTGSQSLKTAAGSRCAMRSTRRATGRRLWIGYSLKLPARRRTYPPSALYSALKVSRSPLL